MADKSQVLQQESDFAIVPLAGASLLELEALLDEEVSAWKRVLHWDYRRTAKLIQQYGTTGLIPGVVLRLRGDLIGYGYYLLRDKLGSIGGIFGSPLRTDPGWAGSQIFSHIFGQLVAQAGCRRIEGQLFTLTHSWRDTLEREGLAPQQRFYMVRDLPEEPVGSSVPLRAWDDDFLPVAASVLFMTYQCHIDARISVAYQSVANCAEFLRNVVLAPGCGEFLCHASALFIDSHRDLGGFIVVTQIAPRTALIPQICVRPDLQSRGIGRGLLEHTCSCLQRGGFQRVFLCVTAANEPARQFYLRHQFQDVQSFSAFFWNRDGGNC